MIAARTAVSRRARRDHAPAHSRAFLKGGTRWQVSVYDRADHEVAQILIDDATGGVVEAWSGWQVAWTMARGYPGAFGRRINATWLWVPLCLAFVAPFLIGRRPGLAHVDLASIALLSVSLAFFNHAEIGTSVPLAYPPLLWLGVRMLAVARRGSPALRLGIPRTLAIVGLVFLIAFKVGLNLANSNVIDVGYSGVIGADRIADGHALYGSFPSNDVNGDTYGPVAYLAYLPTEQALPWSGAWDDLPAAHAAALAFDLLTLAGLWLLGRRARGPDAALALAWGWAACPWTFFVSSSNSNDALVALFAVATLLALQRPASRGVLAALGGLTKFATLALGPLLIAHGGARRFAAGFAAAFALAWAAVLVHGPGLATVWDRTLGFQRERGSPFSVWGIWNLPDALQAAAQAGAVLLALAAAWWWHRRAERPLDRLAALCAAIVIALQLGVTHWFYLYVVWFLPFLLCALVLGGPDRDERRTVPA